MRPGSGSSTRNGSTTKGDLKGISDYFQTPLKVALSGGSGSGDASHIIKGGGKDLTRSAGQVKEGVREGKKAIVDIKAAEAERARREKEYLKGLQTKVEQLMAAGAATDWSMTFRRARLFLPPAPNDW